MDTTKDIAKVAELMKDIKICNLTTATLSGQLVSRPMGVQQVEFDGDLWFFTYEDSSKASQIVTNPGVNVSLNKDHTWVSLSGNAEIIHDQVKAKELWNPVLKAWFPDGLETTGLTLIKVHAVSAEYWDSNSNKLSYAFKMAKAIATDSQPDVSENKTVRLDEK